MGKFKIASKNFEVGKLWHFLTIPEQDLFYLPESTELDDIDDKETQLDLFGFKRR